MLKTIPFLLLILTLIGCATKPAEQKPTQPVRVETQPIAIASTVATSKELIGRWQLIGVRMKGTEVDASKLTTVFVNFCADGRAKFENNAGPDRYDGYTLLTDQSPWQIQLDREKTERRRIIVKFEDRETRTLSFAEKIDCPEDKKCVPQTWVTSEEGMGVATIELTSAPPICD